MSNTIGKKEIIAMIVGAVEKINANHQMLSQLDSATGDGDHGTTMLRSMKAVSETIESSTDTAVKDMLYNIGWAIMSADGGSTGPLLGSFFMGMSESVSDTGMDCGAVAEMIAAGINKMHKQSRAQIGDKTMMDAMLPAMETLNNADKTGSISEALASAAKAAADGAEATTEMTAKFGRARNLGDRVLGHRDPGAVSISLIFKGFCEGLDS
ncbi:MAG: dihydroxyacetone kinase subunit L [Anaerohalosphaera sp.]|nr:dihydroxyacetone kinase subunit L [Anaerohalosphaera sp.]